MLEEVITTSQNSCSTDFENESEKNNIAVNALKTRVKSPGPNPALKNSANQNVSNKSCQSIYDVLFIKPNLLTYSNLEQCR